MLHFMTAANVVNSAVYRVLTAWWAKATQAWLCASVLVTAEDPEKDHNNNVYEAHRGDDSAGRGDMDGNGGRVGLVVHTLTWGVNRSL